MPEPSERRPAGIGTGIFADEQEGWKAVQGTVRLIEPDPEQHAAYEKLYPLYLSMRQNTDKGETHERNHEKTRCSRRNEADRPASREHETGRDKCVTHDR